jgi:hypothetical protein
VLVRFCMLYDDATSHAPQGVFQAAIALRDEGQLEPYEEEWLEHELSWLRMHLPSPSCLREAGNDRAICWFKPQAREPIARVRSMVAMLQAKGFSVDMLTRDSVGTIIYEDQWQVVAKPHRKYARSRQRT